MFVKSVLIRKQMKIEPIYEVFILANYFYIAQVL